MAKKKLSADEKFTQQDIDLFGALDALDRKDYDYYDRLTDDQKKKFAPFMLVQWMSTVKSGSKIQKEYITHTNKNANRYMFDEYVQKHPKLQWLMLCASSPNKGKQFHQWIPQLTINLRNLKEPANLNDMKEFFTKIFPNAGSTDINEISKEFVSVHKKKHYLAEIYPNLKLSDIEILSQLVTNEDIDQDKRNRGN